MKLYVTRHGQTEWSLQKIVCGSTDCDLTEAGFKQAAALAEQVKGLGIRRVVSSPLKRAHQTAEVVASALGLPVEIDERLREQSYGGYENGSRQDPVFLEAKAQFPGRLKGGESWFRVAQRIFNFLDALAAQQGDEPVLLVAHGGVCKLIRAYFEEMSNQEFIDFEMGNCELVCYELD